LTGTWRQEDVNVYSIDNPGIPGVLFYDNTPLHAVMSVTLDPSTDPIPSPGAILIQNENGHYNNLWVVGVDFAAAPGRSFFRVSTGSTIGHNIDKNDYVGGGNTPFYRAGREMTFEEWQQNTLHDLNSTYQQ